MKQNNKPFGVLLLGGVSCFGFGLFFFIISVSAYLSATPEDASYASEFLHKKGLPITVSQEQLKTISAVQAIVALIFFVNGLGLLRGRYWARSCTIYFSFIWAALIFITAMVNPSFTKHLIVQMAYPGILILYFTNRKVEQYFIAQRVQR